MNFLRNILIKLFQIAEELEGSSSIGKKRKQPTSEKIKTKPPRFMIPKKSTPILTPESEVIDFRFISLDFG